jgi:cellulose synthase/poly-beta-1,6-N-acetylglucosamine synthase-like glycosyltransferase
MSLELLLGFTQALALTMGVAFVTYVCLIIVPYLRHKRGLDGNPHLYDWHFFVPCRDEEAVIADTLRYLRGTFPNAHIWVIDDDSDDDTLRIARELAGAGGRRDERIHVVSRRRPNARTGKGDALNAAYRALKDWLGRHDLRARIMVGVVDADGRPAANCLAVCVADHLFGDPAIGAVQIDVRINNRGLSQAGAGWWGRRFGRVLVRMQDLEFRGAIAAIQMSRRYTGTIAMGGNGQFTRLSALDSIAGADRAPWRGSLLEDFEVGVHLLLAGWKTGYTVDTWVDQEGLYSLRRFLAQRTRWGQGTMQCARYVRQIWDSRHVTTLGAAELLYYLSQPWLQLVGTVIYPIPFVLIGVEAVQAPAMVLDWFTSGAWMLFAVYGSFGLAPFVIWGPIYRSRCEPKCSRWRSVVYGFAYALYVYNFYITSWRALGRILRRRNGWTKTRRNTEKGNPGLVALDH